MFGVRCSKSSEEIDEIKNLLKKVYQLNKTPRVLFADEGCKVFRIETKSNQSFACKVLKTFEWNRHDDNPKTLSLSSMLMFHTIDSEFQITKTLKHRNIVKIYPEYELRLPHYSVMVMELAEAHLAQISKPIFIGQLKHHFFELATALEYMHCRMNVAHLDIKPRNILLVRNRIKLSDFGLARYTKHPITKQSMKIDQKLGTPLFYSPEQFLLNEPKAFDCEPCDVYQFGICLLESATGCHPFPSFNPDYGSKSYQKQYQLRLESRWSMPRKFSLKHDQQGLFRHLIAGVLSGDSRKRYTIEQVIEHRWFQSD